VEEAILRTLKYLGRPLRAWEIHKWLIGKKASLRDVEKIINKMIDKKKVIYDRGYYSLSKKTVDLREEDLESSILGNLFKLNPSVKMVCFNGNGLYVLRGEKKLGIQTKDLESAYNLLSLKVLWQKDRIYSKVLEENSWAFKYFPNWTSSI